MMQESFHRTLVKISISFSPIIVVILAILASLGILRELELEANLVYISFFTVLGENKLSLFIILLGENKLSLLLVLVMCIILLFCYSVVCVPGELVSGYVQSTLNFWQSLGAIGAFYSFFNLQSK